MRLILPPLTAILLSLVSKKTHLSLFGGIWLGGVILAGNEEKGISALSFWTGLLKTFDTYLYKAITDQSHLMILTFTFLVGGFIVLMGRSGGPIGIVKFLIKRGTSPIYAQLTTWFMGLLIFFDDYANGLIVGSTMRPICDRFRVSREKLSYIVDSTAAPVSSLAIFSTWIGYEVGLIGDALKSIGHSADPYFLFLSSLPYRFYAIFLLLMIPISILMRREFGGMLQAELRTINQKDLQNPFDHPEGVRNSKELSNTTLKVPPLDQCRWYNAVLPLLLLFLIVLLGIYLTGRKAVLADPNSLPLTLTHIFSKGDSFTSLIYASLAATLLTALLIIGQKLASTKETLYCWFKGIQSMFATSLILILAWGLGVVMKELKTAESIATLLSSSLSIHLIPALVFIVSSLTSFATGTSWGTMAILFPITIPLLFEMGQLGGVSPQELSLFLNCGVGAILTGAIFGDHCSPLSDTTVIASMSCQVNHIDHVRTQIPYALTFGILSVFLGYLPAAYGVNPYLLNFLLLCSGVGALFLLGTKLPKRKIFQ